MPTLEVTEDAVLVDGVEMVKLLENQGVRCVLWQVYGPQDLKKAVALSQGLIQLLAAAWQHEEEA